MTAIQKPDSTALATTKNAVEFQAFGSNEKVKLSMEIVRKWLAKPTKTGKTASDGDVMRFIMLCKARQLNPWEGDAFLVGYDTSNGPEFNLITAHQAFLKRAEAHGQFNGMTSGVVLSDDEGKLHNLEGDFIPKGMTLEGGWANVYRKDHAHPRKARLNLKTFDKGFAQWKTNPGGMIVKCAEADALRGSFPNTLGGMYNDAELQKSAEFVPEPEKAIFITEQQRADLCELTRKLKIPGEKLTEIHQGFGFQMLKDIPVDRYDEVAEAISAAGSIDGTPEPEPAEPIDKEESALIDLQQAIKDRVKDLGGEDRLSGDAKREFKNLAKLNADEAKAFLETLG